MIKDKPTRWVFLVDGPDNSPYHNEEFVISIGIPGDYPFSAPTITFMGPIKHHLVANSVMELPMQREWMPSYTISDLI